MHETLAYRNSTEMNQGVKPPDLDTWYQAYEDMWRMINAGYTQAQVIDVISKEWEDGDVGRFLQWVRFYEGEDDKRYSSGEIHTGFMKVAFNRPGLKLRTEEVSKQIKEYKKKMFSRLRSLRKLIENATLGELPDGVSINSQQANSALSAIGELARIIRSLEIKEDSEFTQSENLQSVSACVSTIEDCFYKIANIIDNGSYSLIKNAETDKKEILRLLTDAHKNFVEKPSVRSLAMAFAKDSLGQFPDIGQALSKMIDAHNYVTPRIEEVMSNISVQIGVENNSSARNDVEPQDIVEPQEERVSDVDNNRSGDEQREIEIQLPDQGVPRLNQR